MVAGAMALGISACGGTKSRAANEAASGEAASAAVNVPVFCADSAYAYVKRQVEFGPRVPNTPAHRNAGDWLAAELRRHGAEVHEQTADLTAFDGTLLKARNIFGRFNPGVKSGRLLLLAHYDTRPWADQDPDETRRGTPADGANDGASGVGVLLELARQIAAQDPGTGIDILFSDAEDYGAEDNEESWALGTRHFASQMRSLGWMPDQAILLDMVGGRNASFPSEYFSRQSAPALDAAIRAAAARAGASDRFPDSYGGAVTDDHLELIKAGVPAVDIIEYRADRGFNDSWHTHSDNIDNIDPATLGAVGQTLLQYIYNRK